MAAITFDTLKYANKLKAAGAEPKLAEVEAEAMAEAFAEQQSQIEKHWLEKQTATKSDIAEIRLELERLRSETQKSIAETQRTVIEAKNDMLKWCAGMLLAKTGLIVALLKILQPGLKLGPNVAGRLPEHRAQNIHCYPVPIQTGQQNLE